MNKRDGQLPPSVLSRQALPAAADNSSSTNLTISCGVSLSGPAILKIVPRLGCLCPSSNKLTKLRSS